MDSHQQKMAKKWADEMFSVMHPEVAAATRLHEKKPVLFYYDVDSSVWIWSPVNDTQHLTPLCGWTFRQIDLLAGILGWTTERRSLQRIGPNGAY